MTATDFEHIVTAMSAHVDSDNTNYTPSTFSLYCYKLDDPLKLQLSCFYQLAFNASEFEKKLRTNSRFLHALQIALMEINLSYAGTDGQIFKCEERRTVPKPISRRQSVTGRQSRTGRQSPTVEGSGARGADGSKTAHGSRGAQHDDGGGGLGGDDGDEEHEPARQRQQQKQRNLEAQQMRDIHDIVERHHRSLSAESYEDVHCDPASENMHGWAGGYTVKTHTVRLCVSTVRSVASL
jgi:hypothetical protein